MTAQNHESRKTLTSGLSVTRYQDSKLNLMKQGARRFKRCSETKSPG
jgi:ribosomal protein L44E